MKTKTSLYLLGAVGAAAGAAVTTYLASKPTLRRQLYKAKSTSEAMRIVGENLRRDGQDIGVEIFDYLENGEMPRQIQKTGKKYVSRFQQKAENMKDRAMKKVEKTAEKAQNEA